MDRFTAGVALALRFASPSIAQNAVYTSHSRHHQNGGIVLNIAVISVASNSGLLGSLINAQ